MIDRLRREWQAFLVAARKLDRQMVVVLIAAVVLVFVQLKFGNRAFFRYHFSEAVEAGNLELYAWIWWFGMQGITGFVIPILILTLGFRRKASEIGLGLGDWKLATVLAVAYAVPVIIGTWLLSNGADFQAQYPHFEGAESKWTVFLIYEAAFLFYWFGWEYLWRGFVLFGTAPAFGVGAIVVQMVPFALLHADKPVIEAYLSILGGLALGALVWRCRSFWIAVPIHAFQMMMLDFWCTLRARSGASGIGLDALMDALRGITS